MRGRTNIPPRVGGIVNGVVREYQVAETSGINSGDYVQIVDGIGAVTKNENSLLNPWLFGPFELSDGTFATMQVEYVSSDSALFKIVRSSLNVSGKLTESSTTIPTTTSLGDLSLDYNGMYVLEIEEDKFLLIVGRMLSRAEVKILTYSAGSWNVENVTINNSDSSSSYITYCKMYKITSNKFVIGFSNRLVCAELNGTTLSISAGVALSISIPQAIRYINGIVVVLEGRDAQYTIETFSLIGTTLALLSKETMDSPGSTPVYQPANADSNFVQISNDKLLLIAGNTGSGSTRYIKAHIITISSTGAIAVSTNAQAVLNTTTLIVTDAAICKLPNDKFMLVVLINSAVYVSFGTYDESTDSVSFDTLMRSLTGISYSSRNTNNALYGKFVLQNDLVFFVCALGGKSSSSAAYEIYVEWKCVGRIAQNLLLDPSVTPSVKKYSLRIDGIAKTSGSSGEMIEVYAPE